MLLVCVDGEHVLAMWPAGSPALFTTHVNTHAAHAFCRSVPTGLPAATTIGRSVTIGQGCLLRSCTVRSLACRW